METISTVTEVQHCVRWTPEVRLALTKQTVESDVTISLVARMASIAATQLFQNKNVYLAGSPIAVGANEPFVPASEMVEARKRIKQFEAVLGRRTLKNEILKEAVEHGKARTWIARSPLLSGYEQ